MKNKKINKIINAVIFFLLLSVFNSFALEVVYQGNDPSKIPEEWKKYFLKPAGFDQIVDIQVIKVKSDLKSNLTGRLDYILTSPQYVSYSDENRAIKNEDKVMVSISFFRNEKGAKDLYNDFLKNQKSYLDYHSGDWNTAKKQTLELAKGAVENAYIVDLKKNQSGVYAGFVGGWYALLGDKITVSISSQTYRTPLEYNSPARKYALDLYKIISGTKLEMKLKLDLTVEPDELPADGKSVACIDIQLYDEMQNPVSDAPIKIERPGKSAESKTNSSGKLRIKYTAPDEENLMSFIKKGDDKIPFTLYITDPRTGEVIKREFTIKIIKKIEKLKETFFISQVIDNPPELIKGKPAICVIKLNWQNPQISEVKTNISIKINDNKVKEFPFIFKKEYTAKEIRNYQDFAYCIFIPGINGGSEENIEANISVLGAKDKDGNPLVLKQSKKYSLKNMDKSKISFKFFPINTGNWDPNNIYDEQGLRIRPKYFEILRIKWLDYMKGLFPIPSGNIIDTTSSNILMEINRKIPEKYTDIGKDSALLYRLEEIYEMYKKDNPNEPVDFVVGVVPSGYIGPAGFTHPYFPHSIVIEESATAPILSHETIHLINIIAGHNQDEYASEISSDEGFWIKSVNPPEFIRYLKEEKGVKTIDIMDVDPMDTGNTWISKENYLKLINKIKSMFILK